MHCQVSISSDLCGLMLLTLNGVVWIFVCFCCVFRSQRGDISPRGVVNFDADSTIAICPQNIM